METAKVLFLNRPQPGFSEVFRDYVPPGFNVIWMDVDKCSEEEIIDGIGDADFLLLSRAGVTERALRAAKRLKFIQLFGQGPDRVPLSVCAELGIPLATTGGANAIAVAEHTVMLMLAVLKRFLPTIAACQEGKFFPDIDRRLYHQLYEKVVGLVALGNIGRHVAKIVRGFGASVIFYDKGEIPPTIISELNARPVGLDELLRTADIISLHVPLLDSTRGMIGRDQFNIMKPSAIFINTSRGMLVDEEALIRALREKRIAGAGVDVYAQEPPVHDNPLFAMENVVATPHIAGFAEENSAPRFEEVWNNIIGAWQGQAPRHVFTEP